jgi:predicted unusual protein kinase regulating ubiquinone biosynthesis (AarF/ABC1/UbiB family)
VTDKVPSLRKTEKEKDEEYETLHKKWAPIAIQDILLMRGLYIKLGQMMTTRSDYAPQTFMTALNVLQDAVPALPFSQIREQVRKLFFFCTDIFVLSRLRDWIASLLFLSLHRSA